jgi:hypothetical protein
LAADWESALREFAAAGPAELRDNGARVAPLSTLSGKCAAIPLLHLWSENHNLTRRVPAITDQTASGATGFSSHGYFLGVALLPNPPLVYLVAPTSAHCCVI